MPKSHTFVPGTRGTWGQSFISVYFLLATLGLYYLRVESANTIVPDALQAVKEAGNWKQFGHNVPVRSRYTGIGWLDFGLTFLVIAFTPGAGSLDAGFWIQQFYFLISFFAVVGIWTVESCRERNKKSVTSFTSIWALFYQTAGGAIVIPLFYCAYLWDSHNPQHFSPASRSVSLASARALLPALIIGYIVPTIAIYLPYADNATTKSTTQLWTALWQAAPLYVNLILAVLSTFSSSATTSKRASPNADLPYLSYLYITIIGIGTISHIGTILSLLRPTNDPNYNFQHAFLLCLQHSFSPTELDANDFFTSMLKIFQWDFWIIFTASLVWAWQSLWDLNRVGLAEVNLVLAALGIVLGSVLIGPAAVLGAVWYYREGKMVAGTDVQEARKSI